MFGTAARKRDLLIWIRAIQAQASQYTRLGEAAIPQLLYIILGTHAAGEIGSTMSSTCGSSDRDRRKRTRWPPHEIVSQAFEVEHADYLNAPIVENLRYLMPLDFGKRLAGYDALYGVAGYPVASIQQLPAEAVAPNTLEVAFDRAEFPVRFEDRLEDAIRIRRRPSRDHRSIRIGGNPSPKSTSVRLRLLVTR